MEKNKDKSHLIDQLYDYVEEQIQELKTDLNQLNHKMQDMTQEKNEKEGAINNQQKIYQIRKVFSPLPLEIEEEKQPVSEDMIQIEKEIHEFQMILREKEEKITKLHDYQKGLEETCLFAEEFVEREDQKILFVPAFEQLMGYVKKLYPNTKTDLFAVFMDVATVMTKSNGYYAMINQHSWMFLSSYEKMREQLLQNQIIKSM